MGLTKANAAEKRIERTRKSLVVDGGGDNDEAKNDLCIE